MRWPALVPEALCKTPITVTLYGEGLDEDGAPVVSRTMETSCNWQDSAAAVRTSETRTVRLSGTALIPGDLCPELAEITAGRVTVLGGERDILRGSKCRNPDGTVNYTRLEVV